MKSSAITAFALAAIALSSVSAPAQNMLSRYDIGESDFIPPPRLITPSTDVVDLRGKTSLEFRWSPHEGDSIQRDHYDFRLYKGYQAFAAQRIFKALIPPRQWSLQVSAELFENGSTYTLALRQVYTGSAKSRRTFTSFKVIK